MKKLLAIILALSILSCLPEKATDTLIFSGKVIKPNSSAVVLSRDGYEKKIDLDNEGNFKLVLTDITEGIYTLWDSVESTSLYLIPGMDLHLSFNGEEFDESISYSGQAAKGSNYLAAKFLFEEGLDIDYKELFTMNEADFLQNANIQENQKLNFLKSVNSLPAKLVELEKLNFFYEKLSLISSYEGAHRYYTNQPDFNASEELNAYFEDIDFSNDTLYAALHSYRRLSVNHYTNGTIEENISRLDSIKSERIKKDILKDLIYYMRPGSENLEEVFKGLSKHATEEAFKADLVSLYEKYKELVKGKPSPTFTYNDNKGQSLSLEDLKGQLVYFDIWATWCGPCLNEIPYLKEVEEAYKGKAIQFVSISIDRADAKEKWLKMIEDRELGGIQLFADKDWSSAFIQAYGINSIPRFILVDHFGNIISADAPRPSSGDALRSLIDESLTMVE
jgi:thiol-disulfide isomerase/thioredoxin